MDEEMMEEDEEESTGSDQESSNHELFTPPESREGKFRLTHRMNVQFQNRRHEEVRVSKKLKKH
jgi:hypothetical protein